MSIALTKDRLRGGRVVVKAVPGRPRRGKRTPSVVGRDYADGDWQRLLDQRDWLSFDQLHDYVAAPLMNATG